MEWDGEDGVGDVLLLCIAVGGVKRCLLFSGNLNVLVLW